MINSIVWQVSGWRSKYEGESAARAEEAEELKRKYGAKLQEAEDQVGQALAKLNSLEKQRQRVQLELDAASSELERAQASAGSLEKAKKSADRALAELKAKFDGVVGELEASQKEGRVHAADLYRLRGQFQDSQEAVAAAHTENKALAEGVKDLYEQLAAGARANQEAEKVRRRLEGKEMTLWLGSLLEFRIYNSLSDNMNALV